MPATAPRHEAMREGSGTFTRKGTDEPLTVNYYLDVFQDYIDYRDGRQVPRRTDILGRVWPLPADLEYPSGPHKLVLDDGTELNCWVQNSRGKVKCSPVR